MDEKKIIIDVHAHILPGVDDGARDMDEACRMLKLAARQGVGAVVATPHYSRRRGTEGLKESAGALEKEIRKEYPGFTVYLGQETYYHEELVENLNWGKALTMAGSRCVLVEFEPDSPYEYIFRGIRALLGAGYYPILAHVERYGCLYREEHFAELHHIGCAFQMNYDSLWGKWMDRRPQWCRSQLMSGRIALLGTDMHRMDFRPPNIARAVKWIRNRMGEAFFEEITYRNPMRMIRGERVAAGIPDRWMKEQVGEI